MSKMLGIIGAASGLEFDLCDDLSTINKKVGKNLGNLVFQYATARLISGNFIQVGINGTWDADQLREKCDKIIFPCANFINPEFDFEDLANYLITLKLPVVALGLGAQSTNSNDYNIPLKKGTEKLIRFLADSSDLVGVRGDYTGAVLDTMGIHNYEVTGCPSNLITPTENLENSFSQKLQDPIQNITINGHHPWANDNKVNEAESFLLKFAIENKGDYLAQSHDPLLRLASGRRFCDTHQWNLDLKNLYSVSGLDVGIDAFEEFVRKSFYCEMHVPSWLHRSAAYDFSIGLRLHGNMVAFQAGTPSLWITHDSRTSELADFMELPRIGLQDLTRIVYIDELRELFSNQINRYFEKRKIIRHKMNRFFMANNIEPSRYL